MKDMSSSYTVNVNESNFDEEVLQAGKPVLVDFWAEWCGPCKMIAPVLEEIAEEHLEAVKIAKANVDENPNLAGRFGIGAIPSLLIFEGGKLRERVIGFSGKDAILSKLGLETGEVN